MISDLFANGLITDTVENINDAPILNSAIADQNAKQGNAFNFQIPTNTFTDIDAGDVLTYSATLENGDVLPSWLTFNPTTRTFSGTPANDNVGSLNIKAIAKRSVGIATDKAGETISDILTITVENVNDAPILNSAIADQTAKVNSTFTFTLPKNTFSDPDAVNPYKNLVIFGDSLSDTGNIYKASGNTFPPSPNYQGRLSNGLIWVDYLAPDLQFIDQSIENFAFSGANTGVSNTFVSNTFGQVTVPGLLTQIQQFKTLNTAIGKDGLYVIWAGANDFLNLATDPTQAVTNAVNNISSAIATLAGLGAKEIVVGNLTDLGATPASIANNNVANARAISIGFNAALNQALTNLEPALNVDLSLVDIFGLSTAVQTNPANYKFTNITQPLITATNPVNPDQYAFWDNVHPTTRLHQLVTDTFENTLLNDGVIPDLIKYSATLADGSNLPDWLNFNSTTRTFNGTPKTGNIGQLDIKVIATDKAGVTVNDIFTLAVENVNNAPTNITINNSNIAENQAIGTVIGTFSSADPDKGNTFTYSLVSGTGATDNSAFTISGNQLQIKASPDFETKSSYSIRVRTTDNGGLTFEKALTINVNNLNEIFGTTGNNNLVGTATNDYIDGKAGKDTLNGSAGVDTLIGGTGNDTYIVDTATDTIIENLNEGTDLVQSSVTYTLGNNLENLTLTGNTAINGTGNILSNTITGNTGNNILDGGAGKDTLIGGAGNDTYIVDSTTDTITDSAGIDTIQSGVDLSLAGYTTIENLNLTGTTAINGTGNSLNNIITGNGGDNILNGGAGNDTLVGGTGNDTYKFVITTTSLGADTITEAVNGGQDTIDFTGTTAAIRLNLGITTAQTLVANGSKLTLTAANAIENVIAGAGADRIIGNDLDNRLVGGAGNDALFGGAGNDALFGGAGNDILTGGTGNDVFGFAGNSVFTVASQGLDTIQDFTPGNDQISLSRSVFASLTSVVGQGFSVASEFAVVEDDDLAGTSNGLIVYSLSSGSLFYNQNSTTAGFGTGGEFAILATAPTLTANNFSLV